MSSIQCLTGKLGLVAEVHGPVVDIVCEMLPPLHRALWASVDGQSFIFEVYQHLDKHTARAVTLHNVSKLRRGLAVFDTGAALSIPVSSQCLGRVLDVFGNPLDGGPPLPKESLQPVLALPPPLSETVSSSELLETGIKVIDLLCPFVKGGKTGLIGGAGGSDADDRGTKCGG